MGYGGELSHYPRSMCKHGNCLGHEPKWEESGINKFEPNPGFLGKRNYTFKRCCGKPMARYLEIKVKKCALCGREENDKVLNSIALCLCCGKKIVIQSHKEEAETEKVEIPEDSEKIEAKVGFGNNLPSEGQHDNFEATTSQKRAREIMGRNMFGIEEDMSIVFECTKEQIAHDVKEINENTKAYVGPLVPGVFDKLQEHDIEHIYTSFPEGRIRKENIEIGGKDVKTLIKEMERAKINISDYAMDMLKSKDFTVLKETESEILIRLKVGDLGFPKNKYPTTDEVYKRIGELGLELCPPETGPQCRLKYADQPMGEWLRIGMKQIADRDGDPGVFRLGRSGGGLWLIDGWADPADGWDPDVVFVFRLRKLKNLKT